LGQVHEDEETKPQHLSTFFARELADLDYMYADHTDTHHHTDTHIGDVDDIAAAAEADARASSSSPEPEAAPARMDHDFGCTIRVYNLCVQHLSSGLCAASACMIGRPERALSSITGWLAGWAVAARRAGPMHEGDVDVQGWSPECRSYVETHLMNAEADPEAEHETQIELEEAGDEHEVGAEEGGADQHEHDGGEEQVRDDQFWIESDNIMITLVCSVDQGSTVHVPVWCLS
jgi:hypothetical protein